MINIIKNAFRLRNPDFRLVWKKVCKRLNCRLGLIHIEVISCTRIRKKNILSKIKLMDIEAPEWISNMDENSEYIEIIAGHKIKNNRNAIASLYAIFDLNSNLIIEDISEGRIDFRNSV